LRNLTWTGIQPQTNIAIGFFTSTGSGVGGDLGINQQFTVNTTAGDITANMGAININVAYSASTRYALQGVLNGSSSSVTLNGSTTSGGSGIGTFTNLQVGRQFDGNVMMMGVWPIAFSGGQVTAMNTLMRSYCGGF
jgi:hypothetical protein